MTRLTKRFFVLFPLLALLLSLAACAAADCVISTGDGSVTLTPVRLGEENWYFLPAFAPERIVVDGAEVDLTTLPYDESGTALLYSTAGGTVHLMRGGLRALFLYSDDPEHFGRLWVEDCDAHENETTGELALYDEGGALLCAETVDKLRGRGNYTWEHRDRKAPYQIKLQKKHNLLNPESSAEAAKKWVLLAEFHDSQLTHNRIANDLALELGLSECGKSTSVDLYYDGEYRGVYTLIEKVEVGKGRVEIVDFEKQQEALGLKDCEPVRKTGVNAYGLEIAWYEGVPDTGSVSSGGYLLEQDVKDGGECASFRLSSGYLITFKNPEYASYDMVCYVSEKMEDLWQTVVGGGTHPVTGALLETQLDIDAMARALLVYDYTYCQDGLAYSSGFFKLPAGSDVFAPGPVWDFDIGMRYIINGLNAGGFGMHRYRENDWFSTLLQVPAVQAAMKRIWEGEMRPMITEILLGDGQRGGTILRSFADYEGEVEASRRMNVRLHGMLASTGWRIGWTPEQDAALCRAFLEDRVRWMDVSLGHLYTPQVDTVCVRATTCYTDVEYSFAAEVLPCFNAEVSECTLTQLTDADEEAYALWEADITLTPLENCAFTDAPALYVNGVPLAYDRTEGGGISLVFTFADQTYKPVEVDGQDYGLILDLDWLRARSDLFPNGADDETLIAYFCDTAMPKGLPGNAYFYPRLLRAVCPELGLTGEFYYDYQSYLDWAQYEWDLTQWEAELMLRYPVTPVTE